VIAGFDRAANSTSFAIVPIPIPLLKRVGFAVDFKLSKNARLNRYIVVIGDKCRHL